MSWPSVPPASGGGGGPGSDTTALHDNVAGEIAAITAKAVPVSADVLVIEDSADSDAKKHVQVGSILAVADPYLSIDSVAGGPSPDVFVIPVGKTIILVDTNNDAVQLDLPPGATHAGSMQVIDIGGNAGTNSITLVPSGGETINGQATYVFTTDNALGYFVWDSEWFFPTWELDSYRMIPSAGPSTHVEGTVFYDEDDRTLSVQLEAGSDVTLQVGQELLVRGTNKTGGQIDNGRTVYIDGAIGNRPTFAKALNSGTHRQSEVIGLMTHDLADNGTGYVTTTGLVRDFDTTGGPESWAAGDRLWLSGVAGLMTNVEPVAPLPASFVGYVIRAHATQGVILVKPTGGYELGELHNVSDAAPADTDILQYDSGTSVWSPQDAGVVLEGVKLISNTGTFTTYTTITAALAASVSGNVVYVGPGTYPESITIPDGVRVVGFPAGLAVIISGADTTSSRVTYAGGGTLREVSVVGPSVGANPAIDASGLGIGDLAVLFSIVLVGGGGTGAGLLGAGAGKVVALAGLYHNGGAFGGPLIQMDSGASILQEAVANAGSSSAVLRITGGNTECRDWLVPEAASYTCTDVISIDGGTLNFIGLQNNFSTPAATNGVHVTGDGCEIRLNACEVLGSTWDWVVDPALLGTGTIIRALSCQFRNERLSFPAAFATTADIHVVFDDEAVENDEAFRIVSELSVGLPELPHESAFGEGDSNVLGMVVKSFDGTSTWVDNTTAAKSKTGSTFSLFQATSVGNIAYIGSLSRMFSGIKVDVTTAAVIGGGGIVWEYWNGTWVEFNVMNADSNFPYESHADQSFLRVNDEQIRFDTAIFDDWATSVLDSSDCFWVRCRVTGSITTSASLQRVKLHTNRTEINKDGFLEFFGLAEPVATLAFSPATLMEVAGFGPKDQDLSYSSTIVLKAKKNRLANGALDGSGGTITIDSHTDTSRPLVFTLHSYPTAIGGDFEVTLTHALHTIATALDGTAAEVTVTRVVPAVAVSTLQEETYEIDISTLVPDDSVAFAITRDARAANDPPDTLVGDVVIESIHASVFKWRS